MSRGISEYVKGKGQESWLKEPLTNASPAKLTKMENLSLAFDFSRAAEGAGLEAAYPGSTRLGKR